MHLDSDIHHRRSIRWKGFDYSSQGLYFVTICTHNRVPFLSRIENGQPIHSPQREIVHSTWLAIPQRFRKIELGPFVVMPNHVHGILANVGGAVVTQEEKKEGAASSAPTLGTIIRAFKSLSAIAINKRSGRSGQAVWQMNYYEHVIPGGREWELICRYIWENPAQWELDPENAGRKSPAAHRPWEP
jgi:REP element-mobilizing transposase RayT